MVKWFVSIWKFIISPFGTRNITAQAGKTNTSTTAGDSSKIKQSSIGSVNAPCGNVTINNYYGSRGEETYAEMGGLQQRMGQNYKRNTPPFPKDNQHLIEAQACAKEHLEQITKDLEQVKKDREQAEESARISEANKHFTQALTYQNEGELDKAIEEYGQSIAAKELPEPYFNRGIVWRDKGEFDKAIANFTKAIELRPKYADFYNNRGSTWAEEGELDKAFADFNKAIELDPKNAVTYYNRGYAWRDKGELDKAVADYNKAIELEPENTAAYNNRGNCWVDKGEFDEAIADYNKAIELDPKNAAAYNNRGYAWAKKGEFDKAIADYDKAIELNPKYATAYRNIAEVLIRKRDFHGAVERLEQGRGRNAFESDRDRLGASCLEGIALALNGDDASTAETKANLLQAGGAKASKWDTEQMERFLKDLKPEDFAPDALETARRIQEMLKN